MPNYRPLLDQINALKGEVAAAKEEHGNLWDSLATANAQLADAVKRLEQEEATVRQLQKAVEYQQMYRNRAEADANRFVWWFTSDRQSSELLTELHLKEINGDKVSVDEWRNAIDSVRSTN